MSIDKELHRHLLSLEEIVRDGQHGKSMSICSYLTNYVPMRIWFPQGKNRIQGLSRSWSGFSGFQGYPVPCKSTHPVEAYNEAHISKTMWVGEYGENRRALLDYLIRETSKWERPLMLWSNPDEDHP